MDTTSETVGLETVGQSPDRIVGRIRERRAELRTAEEQLASAAATPSSARLDLWWAKVSHATSTLAARFHEHVDDTEQPGGLFDEINMAAPRLSSDVERLRADHQDIAAALRALTEGQPPHTTDDVVGRREQILEVLSQLARHRFSGSDLLYEAYQVDIGAAD
jgi:hypothetical protein